MASHEIPKLVTPLFFTCLIYASGACALEKSVPESSACPEPNHSRALTEADFSDVQTAEKLKHLIGWIVRIPIVPYSNDLLTLDFNNLGYAPVSVMPNEDCSGVVSVSHLTVASGFDQDKLAAIATLMGGPSGLDPSVADDVCREPRLSWMKNLNYTHRYIVTTPLATRLNDFTYDYAACSKYIEIMGQSD